MGSPKRFIQVYATISALVWTAILGSVGLLLQGTLYFTEVLPILVGGVLWFVLILPIGLYRWNMRRREAPAGR